jgi:hypothetical protein
VKFAFIEQHASTWPVNVMCRMLGVSRSGYYDWRGRLPSARTMANLALLGDVLGSRRVIRGDTAAQGCMPPCGRKAIDAAVAASSD